MSHSRIIVGIILFALATAILYVWGLKKSMTQEVDLERVLLNKSATKIIKYLKKNETISQKEIISLIQGVGAGLFWSRKRVVIQDSKIFAPKLIHFMIDQQLIVETGKLHYKLKK